MSSNGTTVLIVFSKYSGRVEAPRQFIFSTSMLDVVGCVEGVNSCVSKVASYVLDGRVSNTAEGD